MALDAWVNSSGALAWDYNSSNVAEVYQGHLDELKRIKAEKPRSYHAILHKFFSKCVYVLSSLCDVTKLRRHPSTNTAGVTTHTRKKTKTDTDNLPDTFSD